jgi:hypothetical protein
MSLCLSELHGRQAVGDSLATGYGATRGLSEIQIAELTPLSVLCPWQIEQLRGVVDLFVNFISFQGMEPEVVRNYLTQVRRLGGRCIVLRNIPEAKQKRQAGHLAGVETPIVGDDYLQMLPGYELVERGVQPFVCRTVNGFHSKLLLLRSK